METESTRILPDFSPDAKSNPTSSAIRPFVRRHDLDALRAVAMLLGIVLHASLSFAPIPWSVTDSVTNEWYYVIFAAIHGFRMPLFFLISGYFTAMLWRKRGLSGLLRQRAPRSLVPLIIGCFTIVPAMFVIGFFVSSTGARSSANGETNSELRFFDAVSAGDVETLREGIASESIAVGATHPMSGASLLTVAAFSNQPQVAELLLNSGADPNQKNSDSGTALHVAAFMGSDDVAKLLIDAGANPLAVDGNGANPSDNLNVDLGTTKMIAGMYGVNIDEDQLRQGRTKISLLLASDAEPGSPAIEPGPNFGLLYSLLFSFPVFMHLWFLAFLCWLVILFASYTLLTRIVAVQRLPAWVFCSPFAFVWLLPLTILPQLSMASSNPELFGPGTSVGLLPIPSVLLYYAIFFFFGAVYWDIEDSQGSIDELGSINKDRALGKGWYVLIPLALLVVFPLGMDVTTKSFELIPPGFAWAENGLLESLLQVLYTWMMVFGSIGLFRAVLSRESRVMRYVSDSSYWLYLTHLPLVILFQWLVRDWPIPAFVKLVFIVTCVTAILLLSYEYCVRYTWIGWILNGKRCRTTNTSNS